MPDLAHLLSLVEAICWEQAAPALEARTDGVVLLSIIADNSKE